MKNITPWSSFLYLDPELHFNRSDPDLRNQKGRIRIRNTESLKRLHKNFIFFILLRQ